MIRRAAEGHRGVLDKPHRTIRHIIRREGDEQACSCGKRWAVGEVHP